MPAGDKTTSDLAKKAAAARKTFGTGKKKVLAPCMCGCGQMLGVRERRAHGERRIGGSLGKV